MGEIIIELIKEYGIESLILAVMINVLTGIFKIPIKKIARKIEDSSKITRFIVFLPIIIGFGLTYLYFHFIKLGFVFNREFVTLWTTSSSLSLTIYAILEKMLPSNKKIVTEAETKASEKLIKILKEFLENVIPNEKELGDAFVQLKEEVDKPKFVLRGKHNEKTEIEKK